jgi:excisionase family DNA binding protein
MNESALSLNEVAKLLSIHRQTLWNLRKEGKIKAVMVSKRRAVILRSELERYLASLPSAEE